ncbi:MAG: biopolymer transporter ExbD [Oligoflexales bacterium]|nr:biopolymer transporter ExbD [Oligoflexales bacterium]
MDFKFSKEDEEGEISDINIIPLVDVMLVLLIIFMVTAPLSIGGINVALPSSKAKSISMDEERIVLSIDAKGRYFIEKMEVSPDSLESRLKAIYEFRKKKNIYIRADRNVSYGRVVDAMSAAKVAGVDKMSMLTRSVEQKKTH